MKKKNIIGLAMAMMTGVFTLSSCTLGPAQLPTAISTTKDGGNSTTKDSGNTTTTKEEEQTDERYAIFLLAQSSGYTGSYQEWLDSIRGDEIVLRVEGTVLQWRYSTQATWTNLVDLSTIFQMQATGIASAEVDKNGDLILTYTDGKKQNAGHVVGEANIGSYTVTYDANGGTAQTKNEVVSLGLMPKEPEKPTREGYIFLGWYYGDIEWNFDFYYHPSNITLTARWVSKDVTVIFDEYDFNDVDCENTEFFEDLERYQTDKYSYSYKGIFDYDVEVPELTKEGHTFLRWEYSKDYTIVDGDYFETRHYHPVFESDRYKVVVVDAETNEKVSYDVTYGSYNLFMTEGYSYYYLNEAGEKITYIDDFYQTTSDLTLYRNKQEVIHIYSTSYSKETSDKVQKYLEESTNRKYIFEISTYSTSDVVCPENADIYMFSSYKLDSYVEKGLLSPLSESMTKTVCDANTNASIEAVTVNGSLYAYPLSSENGYFMYYDKSIITDPSSLEQIIADCEAADKLFSFELEQNAWYNSSFMFATGCRESWTFDDEGHISSWESNYNTDAGVVALRGMQKLLQSKCYIDSSMVSNLNDVSAVLISGDWSATEAYKALGDNLGIAKLPSFTVDGKSYQLGSFYTCEVYGVQPQEDSEKERICHEIAALLTNEAGQKVYYNETGMLPTNTNVEEILYFDQLYRARSEQDQFAVPQRGIGGFWWNIEREIVKAAKNATLDDTAALTLALSDYEKSITSQITINQGNAFTVIGDLNGTVYNEDFLLTETSEGSNVYVSQVFTFTESTSFRIRRGGTWDWSWPKDDFYESNVEGDYRIQFTYNPETNDGTIELVKA